MRAEIGAEGLLASRLGRQGTGEAIRFGKHQVQPCGAADAVRGDPDRAIVEPDRDFARARR